MCDKTKKRNKNIEQRSWLEQRSRGYFRGDFHDLDDCAYYYIYYIWRQWFRERRSSWSQFNQVRRKEIRRSSERSRKVALRSAVCSFLPSDWSGTGSNRFPGHSVRARVTDPYRAYKTRARHYLIYVRGKIHDAAKRSITALSQHRAFNVTFLLHAQNYFIIRSRRIISLLFRTSAINLVEWCPSRAINGGHLSNTMIKIRVYSHLPQVRNIGTFKNWRLKKRTRIKRYLLHYLWYLLCRVYVNVHLALLKENVRTVLHSESLLENNASI